MKLRVIVGNKQASATLFDNPSAKDFAALLPRTFNLHDYAGTEKIAELPSRLDTSRAPKGFDPSVGDITYYAPFGNLAIFYRDFGFAAGLVSIGRFDDGMEAFSGPGSLVARFEIA
jgi:hypothetical protein